MTGPLAGVRVLEVGTYVFVPSAAAVLADWGADVLKVEHPRYGDPVRNTSAWGVPANVDGVAHLFEFSNRGKRSIGLDITTDEGRDLLMRLVDSADVFLTNLLPPTQRKLGIEPSDILGRNARIVFGRGTAQGPRGPQADRGGFDGITFWGRSGAAIGATSRDQAFPTPMPGPGFGDLQTGVALAGGIAAALVKRASTGNGVVVDVSLMSAGLWAMGMTISGTSVMGADELPHQDHFASSNPLTNVYRTKDAEYIALGFLQADRYWPEFCLVTDRLDLISDSRFATAEDRSAHATECIATLDDLFAQHDLAEWKAILARQEGQWDVLLKAGRVVHDEQAIANQFVQQVQHEGLGSITLVPAPAQFDGVVTELGRAPKHGEDTDDVLAALGCDDATIQALRDRGVVG